jgi:hypothetical protein
VNEEGLVHWGLSRQKQTNKESPCCNTNNVCHLSYKVFFISYSSYKKQRGSGSSVGIATELRSGRSGDRIPVEARFSARPDRLWGPPIPLYNGYRVFPGGKVLTGCAADHSPPSIAEVLEEYSYTSTPSGPQPGQ